jgi:phospholipid/cholesterol/gamma-HCH transport system substrate-binding protein
MGKRGIEILVGLFVLAGFVAVAYLALVAANLAAITVGDTYTVTARFDNVGGLKPRAPVRSAGVTVGRVASISLDTHTFQGLVKIELERRYSFPKDTSAAILTAGLLGDQYVGLTAGGDTEYLGQGDTIRLTQSAVVLEHLIASFLYGRAAESPGGDSGAKQ